MYRLKSCIDFKPYEGEKTYIKFEKRGGYELTVYILSNAHCFYTERSIAFMYTFTRTD